MEWYRWYHDTTVDPKFGVVARRAGVAKVAVIALWAYLLECASQAEMRDGRLDRFDPEVASVVLDLDTDTIAAMLNAMAEKGLMADGVLANWDKRQFASDIKDPTASDRMRRWRSRKADHNVTDNPPVTDTALIHQENDTVTPELQAGYTHDTAPLQGDNGDVTASNVTRYGSVTVALRPETDPDPEISKSNDLEICAPSVAPQSPKKLKKGLEPWFDEWYQAYPLKRDRAKAFVAYQKAIKKAHGQLLLDGVARYKATKPEWQEWKHPASWLNAESWLDEPPEKVPIAAPKVSTEDRIRQAWQDGQTLESAYTGMRYSASDLKPYRLGLPSDIARATDLVPPESAAEPIGTWRIAS